MGEWKGYWWGTNRRTAMLRDNCSEKCFVDRVSEEVMCRTSQPASHKDLVLLVLKSINEKGLKTEIYHAFCECVKY